MEKQIDFQSMILNLHRFWSEKGCLIWQPYYTQVGAGTMNPATFLRVLGPEPWRVAYVEPTIRPDDGRYGENPYRLQQHYQYQVILKPDPGNPQELYLQSLRALGIDPARHDIRFVEDNWESPALGSWGLGWEVWLDGQEITQFTYFQQGGGFQLDPVSVEITYGLERIAMPLQRVHHFTDIQWSPDIKYGAVNMQGEREHSRYYFEEADVENVRQQYNLFEAEARQALEKGLVLPAHDYILKCSHAFNVLDTRGAIGVTERQAFFRKMRDLSRKTAEAYVAQRTELGFPMLKNTTSKPEADGVEEPAVAVDASDAAAASLLFEIGTEELPAGDLQSAIEQLTQKAPALLAELRLEYTGLKIYGTPRRLVVYVESLASRQADLEVDVKGPPASRAFSPDGSPTPAAAGFAKSRGVPVESLTVREIDGGQYAVASVHEAGKSTLDVLAEALPQLINSLHFEKPMRWNDSNVSFSRPIRWLLALYGKHVITFEFAGLKAANLSRGLRFHNGDANAAFDDVSGSFVVASAADYFAHMDKEGIILDPEKRRQTIISQIQPLMSEVNGQGTISDKLLDEVMQLIEAPTAFRGSFDPERLSLPQDVLVSVMQKHQRYFPVWSNNGDLLPYYIGVRNGGSQHLDVVIDGNNLVLGARFADAAFFITEDSQKKLEEFLPRLGTLIFQFKLGSMLDKTARIETLTGKLAEKFELNADEKGTALRAAHLCKADLVTNMVIEMTSVQGIMGRYYALNSGETSQVADAIFEHYLPRTTGDRTADSMPGLLVGLADRLDSLVGLFAAGLAPTGAKDPFAQRRTALGLVQMLMEKDLELDLADALAMAAEQQPIEVSQTNLHECMAFITGRLRSLLIEQGYRYDIVDAICARQAANPAACLRGVKELSKITARSDWDKILPAYSRCVRITRDLEQQYPVGESYLVEAAERDLYRAVMAAETQNASPSSVSDFFDRFLPLMPAITRFFDEVLVMSEDESVRSNRLGLLQKIAQMTALCGDFSLLEGF